MKKMFVVLAVLVSVVFSAFHVFGDIQTQIPEKKLSVAEEIKMLGFPENIAASFAQIIEQEKKAKPTEPIANGIVVPVAISNGQLCSSGCRFSWPETVGYNPMAKKYTVETYVLYHWKNKGIDIFYRDQLPKLEAKVATLNILPEMKKPAATETATEQQVVVQVTPVTTIPASYTPKTSPSEKRENVEKPVEAYALSLDMSKIGKVVATAVEFPILRTRWINDGIGKYFVFESKEGEAVQKFMSRSSWRSIVSDSS